MLQRYRFQQLVILALCLIASIRSFYVLKTSVNLSKKWILRMGRGFGSSNSKKEEATLAVQLNEIDNDSNCVCGSKESYGNCCGRFHKVLPSKLDSSVNSSSIDTSSSNVLEHPTPDLIARARYSAFCLGISDYLIDTAHHTNKVRELGLHR